MDWGWASALISSGGESFWNHKGKLRVWDLSHNVNTGLPWWFVVKNLPTYAGDAGSIPGWQRSPEE